MDTNAIADLLYQSEYSASPIEPLSVTYPDLSLQDAYKIQMQGVAKRCGQDSRKIIGKKIGLTSLAMQKLLGVDSPDYGHLMDHMLVPEGMPISRKDLLLPKVEGEVAFVLKEDLRGPGITIADVLRATEGVMAAIEIVDSRIRDWKIKLTDTVADNASSARFVLSGSLLPVRKFDLRLIGMVLLKNGEIVNTGAGAAVWGHPAGSVAWLANSLASFGVALEKGEVILSGAVTAAVNAESGDCFQIEFQGLGSVGTRFI